MSALLNVPINYPNVRGRPPPERTIRGPKGKIRAIAFFKDDRRVVTGSERTLRIWDIQNETQEGTFEAHGRVLSVAVSPDDTQIACSGDYKTIIIWDVKTNRKALDPLVGHNDWVQSVCFSPDGKRLASGSRDKTAIVWDAQNGKVLSVLLHHSWVWCVAFSPNGLRLASGSSDNIIRVWQTADAELLLKINVHQSWVRCVVWSPDSLQLISASDDQTVRFWDSHKGLQIGEPCTGHTGLIYSLAISFDQLFIATASVDKTARLWSTTTHQQIGQTVEHTSDVYCVAISPSGTQLASGCEDGKVRLWSIRNVLGQRNVKVTVKDTRQPERLPVPFPRNADNVLPAPRMRDFAHSNKQYRPKEKLKDDHEPERQRALIIDAVRNDLPAPRMRDHSRSDMESRSHDTNHKLSDNRNGASNHSSGSHNKCSLFGILATTVIVLNACIAGDLHTAEELLTHEINAHANNHDLYANRSIVRARNGELDHALQDAVQSIIIKPSSIGYISKGIALCGKGQLSEAMEAFDVGIMFSNRDPMVIYLILLIKAISLFNASHHDEAARRVQDLTTTCQHVDTLPGTVVDSYLRVQRAIIAFENENYSDSADQFAASITSITDLTLRKSLLEPRLKIFTVLFGWDLDSLLQTAKQRRCDALLHADRLIEAIECHRYMMGTTDEGTSTSCLEWSTAFKRDCTARFVVKGDEAVAASDFDGAIKLYSSAIGLDSSCDFSLFVRRSKANLGRNLYAEALADAEKVVELRPSSYIGYELKYDALYEEQRYDEAIEAFKIMFSVYDDDSDEQVVDLRHRYVSLSKVDDAIRRAVRTQLENTPHRLLNTFSGLLCDREAQINAFKTSTEYKTLLASMVKRANFGMEPIQDVVGAYFRCVMLSHRWEGKEPLLRDVQGKVVYELDPVGGIIKLQAFCKVTRNAGYHWAWIDTCCIDQSNNVEVQESVNSMFIWYRHSELTIVYLSDVPPSSKHGALARSVWNTRGWTVQEFLAPRFVLFYQKDWTLYLDDHSPNHKESHLIMRELGDATGIDIQALIAFRPGMRGAREKLQWASTRITTFQEDVAYSLFGIFGINLPVIYGEKKQNALGRLLQEIVAQSGDITALDWVGKSSEFNSCLPADISSYKALPACTSPSLSEEDVQTFVSSLRNEIDVELASQLYTLLDNLRAPRFANRRLQLPCLAFTVTEVALSRGQDLGTNSYEVKANGLRDLLITTEDSLMQFSQTRPVQRTFLLVYPWNRHALGLPDFADDTQSLQHRSEVGYSFQDYPRVSSGENRPVDSESDLRALKMVVRLGQPFGALLLAQQRGREYKRIASDHKIIAQVQNMTSVRDMMDIRILEIL